MNLIPKEGRGQRQRTLGAREIERSASASLGFDRLGNRQPRETGRLSLLGQRCWRKEPAADREPAGPRTTAEKRGDPRTHERAEDIVKVNASAD
jgi:hypothetical protein